ncbi:adenylyl-sulfate kinase [Ekhidna sp.]|uniref:adenylyl-sulfate kinase n=1 Tax=Ekhidna sp. TaxID=2608089 RepID=UPI003298A4D8
MEDYKKNIIPHSYKITQSDRVERNGFLPKLVWFTGLSGSGKSTLASGLEDYFFKKGTNTYILDGDNIRSGLNCDLDFSDESRKENIRRIAEVSKLFIDAGVLVFTAFISPFKEDRYSARKLVGEENFIEVYVDCPLEVCEKRDVKGLYKKAREGKIKYFTGITSPFEAPENPDIQISTAINPITDCLQKLIEEIEPKISI